MDFPYNYRVIGLPSNELNPTWSTTRINLYKDRLIVRVICNDIVEYRATSIVKGLGEGLGCHGETLVVSGLQ